MKMFLSMKTVVLLHLGIFGISVSADVCGNPTLENRIVGGINVQRGQWPWQVILLDENIIPYCGGSLIGKHWIVSAAQCAYDNNGNKRSPSSITVGLGAYRLSRLSEIKSVKTIIIHDKYNKKTFAGDISLLELVDDVVYTKYIKPICLPSPDMNFPTNMKCWETGWGQLGLYGTNPDTLQAVEVPLVDAKMCNISYHMETPTKAEMFNITKDMICAGSMDGGQGPCLNDGGGPLVCYKNNRWYLTGIISFGAGCGTPFRPGVNTLVTAYVDWIHDMIL